MTWTYSGDPAASALDQVRFLIGDTNGDDEQVQDEEILWLVSKTNSVYIAAAEACEAIAGKFGRLVDKRVGPLRIQMTHLSKTYLDLAASLRVTARLQSRGALKPFYGGAEKTAAGVAPYFRFGADKIPGSSDGQNYQGERFTGIP